MNAALKLVTHKNKFERAIEKTKGAIECVDNSLGVDSVDMVKRAATGVVVHRSAIGRTFGAIKNIGFGKRKEEK